MNELNVPTILSTQTYVKFDDDVKRDSVVTMDLGLIAHELSNHLTVISGKAERIKQLLSREEVDRKAVVDSVEKVLRVTTRVADLIKTLKVLTLNPVEVSESVVSMDEVLRVLQEHFGPEMLRHRVKFKVPPNLPSVSCFADLTKLCEIFIVLIQNSLESLAAESSQGGWIELRFEVATDQGATNIPRISLWQVDSGWGPSDGVQKRLFEVFFSTKNQEGTVGRGLELSYARQLARCLGGDLVYEPSAGHTAFLIQLAQA